MVSNAVAVNGTSIMESVIVKGDLSKLSPDERARYYSEVCISIGVNPLTKPFDYLSLSGKLVLYATKTATDQLRTVKGVSIFKVDAETVGDLRIVHAYARDASGREDMDIGAVNIKGLQGEALANAYMKALTKAKRRVTLSIAGLGWLDESEVESIRDARPVNVNVQTGEIIDSSPDDVVAHNNVSIAEPMITENQIKMIGAVAEQIGMSWDQVKAMHGKSSAKELTRVEASNLITKLKAIQDDMPEPDDSELIDGSPNLFEQSNPDRFTY